MLHFVYACISQIQKDGHYLGNGSLLQFEGKNTVFVSMLEVT